MDRRACEARIPSYHRRDPTETLLHRLLQQHLETFLDETSSLAQGLPAFVEGDSDVKPGMVGEVRLRFGPCTNAEFRLRP